MHSLLRSAAAVVVVCAAASPLLSTDASVAATSAAADRRAQSFTAGVESIAHGRGLVTLVGTAPVGTSIELGGDALETVWTEAGPDGTWRGTVRVALGEHVVRVTSAVSGRVIDVPVETLVLEAPSMATVTDRIARTITVDGVGRPGARQEVVDDGVTVGWARGDDDGSWSTVLRDLSFGAHHVKVRQYFDGTHNGGVDGVFRITGEPEVTSSSVSRETGRVTVAGRAPIGTVVALTDAAGPVLDTDGEPVTARVAVDGSWSLGSPIPDGVHELARTVTTLEAGNPVGDALVTIVVPTLLTGGAEALSDGRIRLSGTGEDGGSVVLEDEHGTAIHDADGTPIETTIDSGWSLAFTRDVVPGDAVVARQVVDGVRQDGLHLVLPGRPAGPGPERPGIEGPGVEGPGTERPLGSGQGAHVSSRTHRDAQRVASRITPRTARLASTGVDAVPAAGVGAGLLLAGGALVLAARAGRRGGRAASAPRP